MADDGEWEQYITGRVRRLQEATLLRRLHVFQTTANPMQVSIAQADLRHWLAELDGATGGSTVVQPPVATEAVNRQRLTLFSLNDYLGLSAHPAVMRAAAAAATAGGMGPRSSALVGGYTALHRQLETVLADLKGTEECALLPSGFAANLSALASLAGGGRCAVFSDALNHASIIDGVRLALRGGGGGAAERGGGTAGGPPAPSSGAEAAVPGGVLHVYRHSDMAHLEQLLAACPLGMRKLIVSDSLFSMDGDAADVRALARLKARYGALLVLDEAHATLVAGTRGAGIAEAQGVAHSVDVYTGNFSKAFGSHGGYVACSAAAKALLVNMGRSYVYSTSLPTPVVAASAAALHVARQEPWHRDALWARVRQAAAALRVAPDSPILPLVVGGEADVLAASAALLRRGLHVPAIRPPTVPRGTCRLRVSLSAAHSAADVDALVGAVADVGVRYTARPVATPPARL